jgi:homoserine kinase
MINNCTQGGSLVAAILTGDAALLGAALDSDAIVEPVRAPLIPGMMDVKAAAKAAGGSGDSSHHGDVWVGSGKGGV